MRHTPRFPGDAPRKPSRRPAGSAKAGKKPRGSGKSKATSPWNMLWGDVLPADMIRLKNGRVVRKGEFVVFVRLRSGGDGVYLLSEDLIYLPADLDVSEVEIDRGISLDSPLVLHPEVE